MNRAIRVTGLMMAMLLVAALPVWAGDPGSATAQFLKTGQGARPMGMGGAYAALANDVNAIYWNPGGMGEVAQPEVLLMHNANFIDITNQYLGFVYPLENKMGTVGAAVTYQDYGDFDRTTITSATTFTSAGTFGASDLAIALSYGAKWQEGISYGLNLKYIRSEIESENANAFAADLGVLYRVPDQPLSFGLAIQNLGTRMKFIDRSDKLPLNIKFGVAYEFIPRTFVIALDGNKPIDNDFQVNVGAEYWLADVFALRVGYDSMNEAGNGMTAGAGFRYQDMELDYAWVDGGPLDDAHRVSLDFKFGPTLAGAGR